MYFVASIVSLLFGVYEFLLFIRVLLSWINSDPYRRVLDHPLVSLLERTTDPVLVPLRRIIRPIRLSQSYPELLTIDLSPIVALIILEVVRRILFSILVAL